MLVEKQWTEFGHTFIIERLPQPRQVGASERHFRLYHNGNPAWGGQWHCSIDGAEARARYVTESSYIRRIEWLENRVNNLQCDLDEARRSAALAGQPGA